MSEQGSGNIEYSFNKQRYFEIIKKNVSLFNTYYCVVVLISFFFSDRIIFIKRYSFNRLYINAGR